MNLSKVKYYFYLWSPCVFWGFIIFLFSSVTTPSTSSIYWQDFVVKKLAHLFEYFFLCLFLIRALRGSGMGKWVYLNAIIIAVLYGATDEIHQSFTPGREPHLRDVIVDGAGAYLAVYFLKRIVPYFPLKFKNYARKFNFI